MFQGFTNTATTLAANTAIPFAENVISSWSISHYPGASAIVLRYPGLYLVHFNADVTAAATADVTIQLNVNANPLPQAKAASTVTTGEVTNMGFTTFISVAPCCAAMMNTKSLTLTVNAAATINFANITIEKVR